MGFLVEAFDDLTEDKIKAKIEHCKYWLMVVECVINCLHHYGAHNYLH